MNDNFEILNKYPYSSSNFNLDQNYNTFNLIYDEQNETYAFIIDKKNPSYGYLPKTGIYYITTKFNEDDCKG